MTAKTDTDGKTGKNGVGTVSDIPLPWNENQTRTPDKIRSSHRHHHHHHRCNRNSSRSRKSESVLSTDSDIRFTRRKLGDSQKCGCAVIALFLVMLLLAGVAVYVGYTYFRPNPLPDKIYRGKFKVNVPWSSILADQNSPEYLLNARNYRESINLLLRRSDLRENYEGSEILALDGNEDDNITTVHFMVRFDPYRGLVSTADLLSIFGEEINLENPKYFVNFKVFPMSLDIKELRESFDDVLVVASSSLGNSEGSDFAVIGQVRVEPSYRCEPVKLKYCKFVDYNITVYPNLMGHQSIEEVERDLISFRELVDGECHRQAYDFICRVLQPPCAFKTPTESMPGPLCRSFCQEFISGCGNRLPQKFKQYFDCERYPEVHGMNSCHHKPNCIEYMQNLALSSRMCDGIVDCPNNEDEIQCNFCPKDAIFCGKGRYCVPQSARCNGKIDCPDGSDEKDCLSIAPYVSTVTKSSLRIPFRHQFYSSGFAIFSEKGLTGKICSEGLEDNAIARQTVAESLCKALGYKDLQYSEVRNDTEDEIHYVRVLNPQSAEISFVRTNCKSRRALYVSCNNLECGVPSAISGKETSLTKMALPGDWPWHVALYKADTHVCDGTLISSNWILTTDSCFQGQAKATWFAKFGTVRLNSNPPWMQRRRIVGMVKSPVEGSNAAMVRLESPVAFTDFVRPICLTDEMDDFQTTFGTKAHHGESIPKPEKLNTPDLVVKHKNIKLDVKYFESPSDEDQIEPEELSGRIHMKEVHSPLVDDTKQVPRAEALVHSETVSYPIVEKAPQTMEYVHRRKAEKVIPLLPSPSPIPLQYIQNKTQDNQKKWMNCHTLGWSVQKEQLQRVQLTISEMASCENISIATVNSMCTEAAYHKQDCTEEEFAGSPLICMLPHTKRWIVVGVTSWRIACGHPSGVERPRMYDKIESNIVWIKETIYSI